MDLLQFFGPESALLVYVDGEGSMRIQVVHRTRPDIPFDEPLPLPEPYVDYTGKL